MYYFIVNPTSGSGHGKSVWKTIAAELKALNVEHHAYILTGPGEAKKLASSLAAGTHHSVTLVVVGGDGTLNEVINGLCQGAPGIQLPGSSEESPDLSGITLACIPTGSGNDFVRGLGLERDPIKALHVILKPHRTRHINVGVSETNYFLVSSGLGYDAAVCDEIRVSVLKKALNLVRAGKLVYLITALRLLLTMKRQDLMISFDNQPSHLYKNAYFTAAMNLPYEGGGFRFAPDARPDDGCLDVIIAHDIPRLKVLFILPLAFPGKHLGFKGVEMVRCHKAVIESPDRLCLHTDGEVPGYYDKVTMKLLETGLNVIIN